MRTDANGRFILNSTARTPYDLNYEEGKANWSIYTFTEYVPGAAPAHPPGLPVVPPEVPGGDPSTRLDVG